MATSVPEKEQRGETMGPAPKTHPCLANLLFNLVVNVVNLRHFDVLDLADVVLNIVLQLVDLVDFQRVIVEEADEHLESGEG